MIDYGGKFGLALVCFTAVKQNKYRPTPTEGKLRSLLSLNQIEYDDLLTVFAPLITKKLSHYTLKGQIRLFPLEEESSLSILHSSRTKLDFILTYLKENPNQCYHGEMFDMSQSKVSEWVSYLLPVLEASLIKMKVMPQSGYCYQQTDRDVDYLLIDVTERQVIRDIDPDNQKEFYSGKKKLHTMKNLAITDQDGYIEFISASYMGSVHDKVIWDQIQVEMKDHNLLADLGFVGIEKDCPNAILPFKKPLSKELTELQKQINKAIGSARIRVEA